MTLPTRILLVPLYDCALCVVVFRFRPDVRQPNPYANAILLRHVASSRAATCAMRAGFRSRRRRRSSRRSRCRTHTILEFATNNHEVMVLQCLARPVMIEVHFPPLVLCVPVDDRAFSVIVLRRTVQPSELHAHADTEVFRYVPSGPRLRRPRRRKSI